MSKDVKNTHRPELSPVATSKVTDIAEAVLFNPNTAHRRTKVKFWSRYMTGPMTDPSTVSLTEAMEVTQDPKLAKYWAISGFKEWFLNRDENRERLEYLYVLALDAAEEILTNPEAQASAKVNMIKVIGELSNKFPNRYQQEKFTDDEINKMSELQLKAWLEKRGVQLNGIKPAELPAATEEEIINVESVEVEEGAVSEENPSLRKDLQG